MALFAARQRAPYGRVWPWAVHRTFPPAARRRGSPQRPDRSVGWAARSRPEFPFPPTAPPRARWEWWSPRTDPRACPPDRSFWAFANRAILAWASAARACSLGDFATALCRCTERAGEARRGLPASAAPSTDCSYGCVTTLGRSAARAWPAPHSAARQIKMRTFIPPLPPLEQKPPARSRRGCLPAWGRHSGAGNLAGCIWLIGCTGDRAGVVQQKIGPGGCHSKQPGDPLTAPRAVADRRACRRCKCLWRRGWWGLECLEIRDTALGFC